MIHLLVNFKNKNNFFNFKKDLFLKSSDLLLGLFKSNNIYQKYESTVISNINRYNPGFDHIKLKNIISIVALSYLNAETTSIDSYINTFTSNRLILETIKKEFIEKIQKNINDNSYSKANICSIVLQDYYIEESIQKIKARVLIKTNSMENCIYNLDLILCIKNANHLNLLEIN